ncbi:uncharacterized protein LOC117305671 isoform X3 [Asterias rubens]|uniref:uncharacterized protein LOC117305671 isoform X3 n=1 Tax=Asterias rubens TaxID=7604 RepID=UPI00145581D3|nr:uncharacterized protein LOC117305671 isoform X3 [Asterias rubens]
MASITKEMEEFFEKHRHPYEPINHWKARKQFMINNWDRYSGNQLVSLAMVWSNMEFDGSSYPPELMERVKEMAKGISLDDDTPLDVKSKPNTSVSTSQPFVKPKSKPTPEVIPTTNASEQVTPRLKEEKEESIFQKAGASSMETANKGCDFPGGQVKRKLEETERAGSKFQKTENKPIARERAAFGYDKRGTKQSNFKKRDDQLGNTMVAHDKAVSLLADNLLRQSNPNNHLGSALHRLHNAGSKSSLRPDVEFIEIPPVGGKLPKAVRRNLGMSINDNPTWLCNLYMGDVLMASVESANKPNAKTAAAEKAVSILESSNYVVNNENKVSQLGRNYSKEVVPFDDNLESQNFEVKAHNISGTPKPTYTLDGFVLRDHAVSISPVSMLINSAQSNHVPILFKTSDNIGRLDGEIGYVCHTIINGVTVASGVHMNKREVKLISAAKALAILKQSCPTLKKNLNNAQGVAVNRDELEHVKNIKQPDAKNTAIGESNVGHKLLKMMGWKGGALGKDGIVEPIQANGKIGMQGLGFIPVPKDSATQKLDMKAVKKILENFVTSGRRDDLVFSADLSNDERKVIHEVCQKFRLKSKSHGKGQKRFLVVCQRRNLNDLVQDVAESGGTCGQYELISPGQ